MNSQEAYVIGVDYGTDSVRSIIVNALTGEEIAASVFYYPRWKQGYFCNASLNQFRQHPLDYIEGLEHTIKDCLAKAGEKIAENIKGISIDTTGSTPIAVDKQGTPLSLLPEFKDNPNAMFVLWKDHTSVKEAAEINIHATKFETNYLQFVGGIYSSEWFWSKLLFILREDEAVRNKIASWVEHCDWIPFLLTGGNDITKLKRGVCSAGHKALWAAEFGGLPPNDFFASLDPLLEGFTAKLFTESATSSEAAGIISTEWATRLGLPANMVIGIGAFDCHMGAVGGQIEPYYLSKVMGTSTCDMLVAPIEEVEGKLIKGICGQVPGSIIPGMMGMEAGQSAFGDAYAWLKNVLAWPVQNILPQTNLINAANAEALKNEITDKIIAELSKEAAKIELDEKTELAIDWQNGRRTPDANQLLKGAFTGLGLGTDAPKMFRALVEATCFGAKKIVDRFIEEGIPVKGLIGLGGVAKKSPFIMQMMADVMNMPIRIHKSEQTCALGAAMFAATAAGIYPKVEDAMHVMGQGFDAEYHPNQYLVTVYAKRYQQYTALGDFIEHTTI
jgi:L-ribulokinase